VKCGNSTCNHDAEATAIAAWNRRSQPETDALKAEIERMRNEYIKDDESRAVSNLRSRADEQAEEITRLLELLNAWTELAREHLDTELAGLTFAALRGAGHG
jgi:hypothetical protein